MNTCSQLTFEDIFNKIIIISNYLQCIYIYSLKMAEKKTARK